MVQPISAMRTLVLPEYNGQTLGLSWPLLWPAKDPGAARMDFSLDVSGWLGELQDTIGSFTVIWSPDGTGDLVIDGAFSHNGVVTIFASAGVPYVTYRVTLMITSAKLNETLLRTVLLPVEPQGSLAANSYGMVSGTVSGTIL